MWTRPARRSTRPTVATALASELEAGGAEAALARYRALEQAESNDFRFGEGGLYRRGFNYLREGNTDAAHETFRLLGLLQPGSPAPLMDFGDALMEQGDVATASDQYRAVLEQHPGHLGATWSLFMVGAPDAGGEIELAPDQLRDYVGRYRLPEADVTLTLTLSDEGGHLLVLGPGQPAPFPLAAVGEDRFFGRAFPMELVFVRDEQGRVTHLEARLEGGVVDLFERID